MHACAWGESAYFGAGGRAATSQGCLPSGWAERFVVLRRSGEDPAFHEQGGSEIYLTRAGEHCDTDEEDQCVSPMKREVYGKKGPVYAFDISTDTMTKILYVEPTGVEPAAFSPGSKADLKPIREILSTLKVFRVDGPKATCIQDLSPGQGFALPVQPYPPKRSSPTSQ
jgi:hypothetical protein